MDSLLKLTKEQLVEKVNELSVILEAIKDEKNQQELLNFPWIGNLGNWYWYIKSNRVVFNDHKIIALGYSRAELPKDISYEFFTSKLHPEEYERVMENMRDHLNGRSPVYETSYRIEKKDGSWVWFYDRGKVTKRDKNGKPELLSGIVFDITAQKHMEELLIMQNQKLDEMSRTDYLTGLNNRRVLFEKLDHETKRANRTNDPLSILFLDIDHFKKVNDVHGHSTGDSVLVEIANLLRSSVRVTDFVGRYGGEEFMVILPACNSDGAMKVAEKIRVAIQESDFGDGLKITISGGIRQFHGESVDQMIEFADQNLFLAKKNGRNQIAHIISTENETS
jgi:diguanylate cyclase